MKQLHTIFNFKWAPHSKNLDFEYLQGHGMKKVVNHFEFHYYLSNKDDLYMTLNSYFESQRRSLLEIIPMTFVIDCSLEASEELNSFNTVFNTIHKAQKQKLSL